MSQVYGFTTLKHLNSKYTTVHVMRKVVWATSWENLFMPYSNNKGADQPAHPRSLIGTFVFRFLDSIIPLVPISKLSRLWLVLVAAQAGLYYLVETPISGFLVTGLNFIYVRNETFVTTSPPPVAEHDLSSIIASHSVDILRLIALLFKQYIPRLCFVLQPMFGTDPDFQTIIVLHGTFAYPPPFP